MNHRHFATAALLAAIVHLPLAAQEPPATWRCADNSYSDRPCPAGRKVEVSDPRSDADRRAADAATRQAERRGDEMARARMKQEAQEAERARRAAQAAQRQALAERKAAAAEKLAAERARRLAQQPHRSTRPFKGPAV